MACPHQKGTWKVYVHESMLKEFMNNKIGEGTHSAVPTIKTKLAVVTDAATGHSSTPRVL